MRVSRVIAPNATPKARRACLLVLAATVATLFPAGSASANSRCTFSDGVVQVKLDRPRGTADATLKRRGNGKIYYTDGSGRRQCGGATVSNTKLITVEDVAKRTSTHFRLDISEGHFARGKNEIPIRIDLGPSGYDSFIVYGGRQRDHWTFGRAGANLQRDHTAEIVFANPPDTASAWTRGGVDRVCASGGRGTGRASLVWWIIEGGARDDTLCGGGEEDLLVGADGDDTLRGRGESDHIDGSAGRDHLYGNAGEDFLEGEEGGDELVGGAAEDSFNGGPAFDRCDGRGDEIERNCEQ